MDQIKEMESHMAWCNKYIEYYRKNHTYDPLATLTNQETKEQELFGLCVEYLYSIEEMLKRSSGLFEAKRNEIIFKERSEQC